MPRKKRQRVASRAKAASNYPWHRRVPWLAIGAGAIVLVVGALLAQSFGVGESAGQYKGPVCSPHTSRTSSWA